MEDDKNEESKVLTRTSASKIFSYIGAGIGIIIMIAYIPRFDSQFINFIIGAGCGGSGAIIGGVIGGIFDKKQ